MVLFLIIAFSGQGSLEDALATAEQKKAQVRNVLERQVAVHERYQGRPSTVDSEAEISGAENRVRVERRRYDEAASEYNAGRML